MRDSTLIPILKRMRTYGYTLVSGRCGLVSKKIKTNNPKTPSPQDLCDLYDMMFQRSMISPTTNMSWDEDHVIELGKMVNALLEVQQMIPREYRRVFRKYSNDLIQSKRKKQFSYNKYRDIVLGINKLKK